MKKELSYLKYLVPVLNIALGLQLFGFVIGLILLLIISVVGLDQIVSWGMTFAQQHGGQVQGKLSSLPSLWLLWLSLLDVLPHIALTWFIRKFCKNLLEDRIFIAENATLACHAAIALLFSWVLSISVGPVSNLEIGFDGFPIIAAILVWTISKVLEQANAIAEENDFTI
ncbi:MULTISPECIES: DUF2975 domain-containing protein [unclassified Streptococcus]|uniref:DUF2975 domain-containing protein n=1 Tax=unclassified Streptococcus TaxID=2608887 RepID=UPI00359E2673